MSTQNLGEENGGKGKRVQKTLKSSKMFRDESCEVRNSMMTQYHQETTGKIPKRRNEKEKPIKQETTCPT